MNKSDIMQIIHWVILAVLSWFLFTGRGHERFNDFEHKNGEYYEETKEKWKSRNNDDDQE